MSLLIITIYLLFTFIYFIVKLTNIENNYIEYYNTQAEDYNNKVYLTYDDFKKYYQINKSKWKVDEGLIFYNANKENILICFNKKDALKVNRFISNSIENNGNSFNDSNKENLELLLNSIQKDIDKVKKTAYTRNRKSFKYFYGYL